MAGEVGLEAERAAETLLGDGFCTRGSRKRLVRPVDITFLVGALARIAGRGIGSSSSL